MNRWFGGEENPFRRPVRFSSDRLLVKDNALYVEEPYNETLFPSANVGYSKVTVKPLQRTFSIGTASGGTEPIISSAAGYSIYEFYTAKDYPVITSRTGVTHIENKNKTIFVPFVGSKTATSHGYSQGYSIELNDMHGKPKKVSNFGARTTTNEPISYVSYSYHTQNGYHEGVENRLDNNIRVLDANGIVSVAEMGKHVDVYSDQREGFSRSESVGTSANLSLFLFAGVPVPVPKILPNVDLSMNLFRSVVMNKVITRNGILKEVSYFEKGARVDEKSLYYDQLTGEPIITSRKNSFGNQVTTYNYPAHWEHPYMGAASENIGIWVDNATDAQTYLKPGDVLFDHVDKETYWVESTNPLSMVDDDATPTIHTTWPQSGGNPIVLEVIRSGNRNLQSMKMGQIVSIEDVIEGQFPVFQAYVDNVNISNGTNKLQGDDFSYVDCEGNNHSFFGVYNGVTYTIPTPITDNQLMLYEVYGENTCSVIYTFDSDVTLSTFDNTVDDLNLSISDDNIYLTIENTVSGEEIVGQLTSFDPECLEGCFPGVLNTYASVYSDQNLNYDYSGIETGDPVKTIGDLVTENAYRYGARGIWRLKENKVFLQGRKQTTPQTNIEKDGTINEFTPYEWGGQNLKWTTATILDRYSPYGYVLEETDVLGRKSSALYGYEGVLVTAVASNTPYQQLAYDGFEDHGNSYVGGTGHISFSGSPAISTEEAHTGSYSLKASNQDITFEMTTGGTETHFVPDMNKRYYFSCWVKTNQPSPVEGQVKITIGGNAPLTFTTSDELSPIEGWKRIEGNFTAPVTSGTKVYLRLSAIGGDVYFDDLRIQPLQSAMRAYVYDPNTYWLTAELDDNNYATFYNYDEEGSLVQTKKENGEWNCDNRFGKK